MERVLKAGTVARWTHRRISGQEWQAGERVAALLADARAEAAALLRDADRAIAQRQAAAAAEGHAEGLARAAAQLAAAQAERARWLAAAEEDAVALGLDVARRILGRELQLDAAAVRASAEEALLAARGRRRITLRLHPAAAAALRDQVGPLAAMAGLSSLRLVPDPALGPGDAHVETEAGAVDARLEARLEAFRSALAEGAA
jgi:flagellar biosynthesis/type III secretory pathway protein FliH